MLPRASVETIIKLLRAADDAAPIELPPVIVLDNHQEPSGILVAADFETEIQPWYDAELRALTDLQWQVLGEVRVQWALDNRPNPVVSALYDISGLRDLREGSPGEKLLALASMAPWGWFGRAGRIANGADNLIDAYYTLDKAGDLYRIQKQSDRVTDIARGAAKIDNVVAPKANTWVFNSPERIARYEAVLQRAIASGRTGEKVGELGTRIEMMRQGYRKVGEGIFNRSRNGIDAVYRSVTTGDVAIVESKFNRLFNANRNAESLLGKGWGFRQMSHDWIDINIQNALNNSSTRLERV